VSHVNPSGSLAYLDFALPSFVYNGILKEKAADWFYRCFDVQTMGLGFKKK